MLSNHFGAADPAILQKCTIEIHTHQSLTFSDHSDHSVGQIPGMSAESAAAGVTGNKRLISILIHIFKTGIGKMRYIDQHTEPFHFSNHLQTERLQTGSALGRHVMRKSQFIFIVPRQGDQAYSFLVKRVQTAHVIFQNTAFFYCEKTGKLSGGFVAQIIIKRKGAGYLSVSVGATF